MMDETKYYDLPDMPLYEFLEQFDNIVKINCLEDMKSVIGQLEVFQLFESASDLQGWYEYLKNCIASEFDETCLTI
jgi:hypothetical protein